MNPDHLFLGTHLDNNRDMLHKGRAYTFLVTTGEQHGMSKLTAEKVLEIRAEYETGNTSLHKLGAQYGVSYMTIWHVVKRHTWKSIM